MNASTTAADTPSTSTTKTSTYRLDTEMYVRSRRLTRAKRVAEMVEREIRALLSDHGLRTSHVEPDFERHSGKPFRTHFHLRTTCLIDCTEDEIDEITLELQNVLEESEPLARLVPVDEIEAFWEIYTPRI